jgi:cell division protein FtsX
MGRADMYVTAGEGAMKFLLSELLRTIVRSWRLVGWVLGGAVIAALAFVIFLILWVARGEWGENRLIVLFEPGVSGEQIRQVYRQVREWEAISEVLYITRDDPRLAQDGVDPERAPAGYLRVTVRHASQAAEAQAALRDLPGVAAVQSYQKGALRTLIASDSGVRTAVTLLQIGALALSTVALFVVLRVLAGAWRGELEILYLSGVAPRAVRGAFFSFAVLSSLVVGVLALCVIIGVRDLSFVHQWVPELSQPGSFGYVSVMGLGVAALVGMGAGAFGAWVAGRRL